MRNLDGLSQSDRQAYISAMFESATRRLSLDPTDPTSAEARDAIAAIAAMAEKYPADRGAAG